MIDLPADHLGKEVGKEAQKALDVLFASKEDFFTCNGRLPKLFKSVLVVLVQDALVKHQALVNAILQVLQLRLVVYGIAHSFAPRILAVDEKLDR